MKKQSDSKHKKSREKVVSGFFSLIVPTFKRHKKRLFFGFSALFIVDFLQLMIPRVLKVGVDGLAEATISETRLLLLALLIVAIAIIVGISRYIWRNLILGFSRMLERDIRERIFSHILKMDLPFFEQQTTGKLMAHISNDVSAIQTACGMGLVAGIDGLVMSLVAIILMMSINIKLTLLVLLPMPFLAICTLLLSSRIHKKFDAVQSQFGLLTEFVRTTLVSIHFIKAYGIERFQTKSFDKLGRQYVRSNLSAAMLMGFMFPISTLVGNTGLLLVLYYGGTLVIENQITIGDFVAFTTYLYMLIWPIMAVGWVANLFQRGATSIDRIYTLLSKRALLSDSSDNEQMANLQPRFGIKHLTFAYPGAKRDILQDITLSIEPGILGITGPTGSGKSTLCKVLSRLYPVPDGAISLDDHDVNDLPLSAIRQKIGYVGQEPFLFSDSILSNIRFGIPDATLEDVQKCAKIAGVHNDILSFTDGYDTIIGERGVTLSGGQKQRVALARALLYDREILIIDDGLSALDVDTENEVFEKLKHHLKGKTVVIVSHRIKLLSMTDRVIILDEGQMVIEGTHEQLLQANSFYQAMHDKQIKNRPEVFMEDKR